ncbi:MAG: translocation/assembly module TamB [Bacteroidales bacterium]|nr:translocation/assembly module TamB [Bacteroidales bacterium]
MRRAYKIIRYTLLGLILLIAVGALLVQIPAIQTGIIRGFTSSLSNKTFDAEITFSSIKFRPFNTLIVKDFTIIDKKPYSVDTASLDPTLKEVFRKMNYCAIDTLFSAENVIATFTLKGLMGKDKGRMLRSATVRNGVLNLVIEENGHKINITRMFRITEEQHKETEDKDVFLIRKVDVEGLRLTMKNYRTSKHHDFDTTSINWNDMVLNDIVVHGRNLKMRGKVMSGVADYVSLWEKSGYRLDFLSASTSVGQGEAIVEDIHLIDPWSKADVPHFSMHYAEAHDLADFPPLVRLVGELNPSSISFTTLNYFAPKLPRKDFTIDIQRASVEGPLAALNVEGDFAILDKSIRTTMDIRTKGLPRATDLTYTATLKNTHVSTAGIQALRETFSGGGVEKTDITKYAAGIDFTLNGTLFGSLDDMKFNGYVRSPSDGSFVADLRVRDLVSKPEETKIGGVVRTSALDLHNMVETLPVRECTADAAFDAELPRGKSPSMTLDTLRIKALQYNGYNYNNISGAGTFSDNSFDGRLICNEPNLNFLLQGVATVSSRTNNAGYVVYANVGHADLHALNLDKRGRSEVALQVGANFMKNNAGDWLGDVNIENIELTNASAIHKIGDMKITSRAGNGEYRVDLDSKFATGKFTGSASITQFYKDAVGTAKLELPSLFKDAEYEYSGETYKLTFHTFSTSDVLAFVAPGVYVAGNSSIEINLDRNGLFTGEITSQRLAFRERFIKDFALSINNRDNVISGSVTGGDIDLSPLYIRNNRLDFTAKNDRIEIEYVYDNNEDGTVGGDVGKVAMTAVFSRDAAGAIDVELQTETSDFRIDRKDWTLAPSNVLLAGNTLSVNDFEIYGGEQSISARGKLSDNLADTLDINVTKMDLSSAGNLLGDNSLLSGVVTGKARITSPKSDRRVLLDFKCDSVCVGGERVGDIELAMRWDNTFSKYHMLAANSIDGETSFSVYGTYTPSIRNLDLMAKLNSFNLACASPFFKGVFSEVGGAISGDMVISGPVDNISIRGRAPILEDARMRVAYTNVAYTASGPCRIDDYGVYFDEVSIADDFGNTGLLYGKIGYDHLRDLYLDVNIDLQGMQVIDLDEHSNKDFYGRLFATGSMSITGPLSGVSIYADMATNGSGDIHIPLSSTQNAGLTDLLKFKEEDVEVWVDPYEEYLLALHDDKDSDNYVDVRLLVETNPEVEVAVEIDKTNGNVMWGRGSGTMDISMRTPMNGFNISGDYTLSEGNYHFVALGLAARDFAISEGSSIRFNGDIMSSTLDIDAAYKTKVSLATLIADTTSVNTRRTVECGVKVTDKLSNPKLAFSINIPDLDPTIKAQVESALSTEDKVEKQFLALLVSNSFIPDEQSSIVNSSSVLFSNVSEIMSNQLNTILQRLNIPLDLGVNYQQTDSGNDVFDVAVSTQLFNNRVTVYGNIGNRQYSSSSGAEIAGDVDIDIKLDRAGAFRLSLFSHSADPYTNYLDDTQRNGIGVTFQQEYERFGQWVRRVFTSKERRLELDAEEAERKKDEEVVEIKIK